MLLIESLGADKFEGQRAHEKRIKFAKHLHRELKQAQLIFSAVRFKGEKGQPVLQLIDGYTRLQSLKDKMAFYTPGTTAVLNIIDCKDKDEVFEAYMAYDSPASVKKARDRVDEGMRVKFGDVFILKSALLANAPICTAMRHINTARWSKAENQARMVAEYGESLRALDALNLLPNKQRMCAPLFAAILYAIHYTRGEFQTIGEEYARGMLQFTCQSIPADSPSGAILRDCYLGFAKVLEELGKKPTGAGLIEYEIRRLVKGFGDYFEARLPELKKRCKVKVTDVNDKEQILNKIRDACLRYAA